MWFVFHEASHNKNHGSKKEESKESKETSIVFSVFLKNRNINNWISKTSI